MPKTLRRSCAACAKSKHSCDLRTPKCSRCVKRNCDCFYANEPLTSTSASFLHVGNDSRSSEASQSHAALVLLSGRMAMADLSDASNYLDAHMLDPFDSYPTTNLPRPRVQALMRHFLSKIAFQYYPLDLNPASNPFVTSWWPLALTDPALFHVTLQTASLDDELQARKGFPHSELLMKDSVSLLRQKVQHRSLAFQDATMNAVVTLAAIEHGKGNLYLSKMHIDGVKQMIKVRGGISLVKQTSPLTARMVAWVSMLVTGSPQFDTQDDFGEGDGVSAIPQWQWQFDIGNKTQDILDLDILGLDRSLGNTLSRLRSVFGVFQISNPPVSLSTTDLHDLTSFILHRLLNLPPFTSLETASTNISECLRYGVALYMLIIHGPTYYSHVHLLNALVLQLEYHLDPLLSVVECQESLLVWLLSIGAVASIGTSETLWFHKRAAAISMTLGIMCWDDVKTHLKRVLWLENTTQGLFQQNWQDVIGSNSSYYNNKGT